MEQRGLDRTRPYRVTAPGGKLNLVVMNSTDALPTAFALMGTKAADKVAIRLSGGCKGMSSADKEQMLGFFAEAFDGFRGVIWSGGTRQVDGDGRTDPMVTDVPGVIARLNPGSVVLGTVPRTEMLTLQEDSRLVLNQYGNVLNPDMHGILVVQNGPDGELDWDGDLAAYFQLMQHWRDYAGFTALGLIAWNGGPVTREEIMRSAKKGWPTIVVTGTGRVADEISQQFIKGDLALMSQLPKEHQLWFTSKENPQTLHRLLKEKGFIA